MPWPDPQTDDLTSASRSASSSASRSASCSARCLAGSRTGLLGRRAFQLVFVCKSCHRTTSHLLLHLHAELKWFALAGSNCQVVLVDFENASDVVSFFQLPAMCHTLRLPNAHCSNLIPKCGDVKLRGWEIAQTISIVRRALFCTYLHLAEW